MLQPVGPLPASLYWRRRAMVAVAALLVLILGWQLLPGGGDERQPTAGAAGSPTPGQASSSLAATPPPDDPGRGTGGGTGTAPGAPGAGTPTAAGTPATPTAVPTTAAPPAPCADDALTLRVGPRTPTYRVGQTPVLDLEVRNSSRTPCARDLGAAEQEIVLYAGSSRLWSSNDCYPQGTRDPEVLAPGVARSFSVTWSGLSSRPRCVGERTRVGPGTYQLVARVGTLVSRRAAIVLR